MKNVFRQFDRIRLPLLSLVAGCLVACSIDWPVPVVVQKDTTVAFPCQTRGCGCKNADQCWKSCCCFSDSEKLAWANAHDITPPTWFTDKMSAAKADGLTKRVTAKASPRKAKATEAKKSSCCCCCKTEQNSCEPTIAVSKDDESTKVDVRLSLKQQRGCSGQLDYQFQHLVYLPLEISIELPKQQRPHFSTPLPMLEELVSDLPTPPPRDFWIA